LKNSSPIFAIVLAVCLQSCEKDDVQALNTLQITTSDKVTIEGDLFGEGDIGLVMVHGLYYLDGKDSFRDEVRFFGSRGVSALAISFRGYPSSDVPPMDGGRVHDIVAGVNHLAGTGCTEIYVLGSSMGGWIALQAVHALDPIPAFAGLVILSAGRKGLSAGVSCRKLFIAAEDDPNVLTDMRELFKVASMPKRMEIFRSGGHGQKLFLTRGEEVRSLIFDFITGEYE
jgi:pimeloyl-ACP methyl ester carboxylesterase